MDQGLQWPLRPLDIGEIFDRAVAIYVRNFVLFTAIVLVMLLPTAVAQYFYSAEQSTQMTQLIDIITHPEHAAADKTPPTPLSPRAIGVIFAAFLLSITLGPVANNAVAIAVAGVYFGRRPSLAECFGKAFRRWLPILGLVGLAIVGAIGAYIAVVLLFVAILLVGVALVRPALPLAVIVFGLAIVVFLAVILAFMLLVVVTTFALYAIALENAGPIEAYGKAFARIFSRSEIGKATVMALAFLGVQLGVVMVSGTIGMLVLFLTKNVVLQVSLNALVSAMLAAFTTVLLAVYYYDVRTRREGLDLEADLARLATT